MAPRRVLLVHDEPELSLAVKDAFEDLGCTVDLALDPGDAVSRLIERRPDLVFVSLNLPRDSGYDLCELIRGDEELDRMRIVVMSDRSSPEDIAYAEEAGADVFVKLPSPSKSLVSLAAHLAPLLRGEAPLSAPGLRKLSMATS